VSEQPPPLSALLIPQVMIPIVTYMLLCFTDMSSQVLRPLVYSTSIANGGLGFDPYKIGSIMGTWGVINVCLQVFFLGRLIRRFGPRRMHILAQCSYVVIVGLYPLLSYFARRAGTVDGKVWAVMVVQLFFSMTNNMAYGMLCFSPLITCGPALTPL
jgi:hypothetical protein